MNDGLGLMVGAKFTTQAVQSWKHRTGGGWSGNRIFTNIRLLFTDLFAYPETRFDQK